MSPRPATLRLDQLISQRGLAPSRQRAQALVLAGRVQVDGRRVDKAGTQVAPDAVLLLQPDENPYVSRGGVKLHVALEAFKIDPTSYTVLDVGASTGGFTDCLIQAGAHRVIALDVGHGQIDWNLRNNPRVTVVERFNARHLTPATLREALGNETCLPPLDLAVADVSFISLALILPALATLSPLPRLVCLVKPQFEAGRREVGRGGLVRDPAVHSRVLTQFMVVALKTGWQPLGLIPSPLRGARGNREFLADLERRLGQSNMEIPPRIDSAIRAAVQDSVP